MYALCVEASHARGMGHLYRGLVLADALERQGAKVQFLINAWAPGEAVLRTRGRSFEIVPLHETGWETDIIRRHGIGVWINDRLDTGAAHAASIRETGARLATFEDRGAGAADADLNVVAIMAHDSERPPGKHGLAGMKYLVLDPVIARYRRQRDGLKSLVVSMGGSDTYGVTVDVVRALKARKLGATVVLGPGFAHDGPLNDILDDSFILKRNVPSLAAEFAHHDLAITAGGMTPCEANAAGLPCIIIATESWEIRTGEVLAKLGGCLFAGYRDGVDFGLLDRALPLATMSQAALDHVPADGADRVARAILTM